MKSTSINRVIEDFNSLALEEKEFALEIIRKMLIEAHRESLLKRAHAAIGNYTKGKETRYAERSLQRSGE